MFFGKIVWGHLGNPCIWQVFDEYDNEITPDNFGCERFTTWDDKYLTSDFNWFVVEPTPEELKVIAPFIPKSEQVDIYDHSDCDKDLCDPNQPCMKVFVLDYQTSLSYRLQNYYHGTPWNKRIYWEEQ